jgi:enterochelin esterase-like enzyme
MLTVLPRLALLLVAACLGCSSSAAPPLAPDGRVPTPDLTQPWVTPAVSAPGVQRVVFRSAAVGGDVSYHVYLPPAYSAEPTRRFPVLYWLHGTGGGAGGAAPLSARSAQAIAAGVVPPFIMVFPNGLPNGMWVDDKAGRTPVETMLLADLMPDVDARFRTQATRAGRVIEGFSMGGYGALRLGFAHPERFGAISSLAGGPLQETFDEVVPGNRALRDQVMRDVYGNDMAYFRRVSPWRLAEALRAIPEGERPAVRLVIGARDAMVPLHATFEARLRALAITHELVTVPDVGHETLPLLEAMGDGYWAFLRRAFTAP